MLHRRCKVSQNKLPERCIPLSSRYSIDVLSPLRINLLLR
ncbi:hypothetical protein BRC2024_KVFYQCYK_CDS_0036 [Acinetobacter phage vB_AbaP_Fishpie]